MVGAARDRRVDARAHVERGNVEADLLAVAQRYAAPGGVEFLDHASHELHVGALGQTGNVDDGLALRIVAGDDAWQHAGIDLARVRRDQRDARAVKSIFRQGAQHHGVRVPGADKQDSLHAVLSLAASSLRSSLRCTLPLVVMATASMNSISPGYS